MKDLSHGGDLGFLADLHPHAPRPLVDLSTGINPVAYPVQLDQRTLGRLPGQSDYAACVEAFARYAAVSERYIQVMPGSQSAISILPTLIEPCDVAILEPTYSEHEINWTRFGHRVTAFKAENALSCDADIIVLTNPNNPDGHVFDPKTLSVLQERQAAKSGWLIVDEAFIDASPDASFSGNVEDGGLIVLRSFGKFFGLAGLRLGFVLAPEIVNARLRERLGPWGVNGLALHVGAAAYADDQWINTTRDRLDADNTKLANFLSEKNLAIKGGTALFQLVQTAHAQDLASHLASRGIFVRTFDYDVTLLRFGLPGQPSEWDRLKRALAEFEEMT